VGRLAYDLPQRAWREIADRHRVACHGFEHARIQFLGRVGFEEDLLAAKCSLEDVSGQRLLSYRAPYFSGEHCDPWFGEALARAGFILDSSRRLRSAPLAFHGTCPLIGSGGAVQEVPLPCIGSGAKRITIIGGSYLRLLPLSWSIRLLEWGRSEGFIPMVYLHPYDLDPEAAPLEYERFRHWLPRLGDRIRRLGRETADIKLRALCKIYDFCPIESLVEPGRISLESDCVAERHVYEHGPASTQSNNCRIDEPRIGLGNPNETSLHIT
jgi:hypothetical protein